MRRASLKGLCRKGNAEARVIGQSQAILRGQFDGCKAMGAKSFCCWAANSIVPDLALANQAGTHLGRQHEIARPNRTVGWNGGREPALHHGEHEIKNGLREARGAARCTYDARKPCGAAYPFGKHGAHPGTAAQEQLGLESRNVPGFDAVLEIAPKAGVEAIDGLIACGITGDDFPCALESFAD